MSVQELAKLNVVNEKHIGYSIRLGYKQTAVGLIPATWEVRPLVGIATIRSGIAKNSKVIVSDPVDIFYLRVANVQDGYLDLTEMSRIRITRNDVKRYEVLSGDMLMNEGGDLDQLGRGALWRGEYSPCVHQNHVFVVRCGKFVIPDYLNAWTGATPARQYFLVAGKQTTNLASINKTALGQLPVALPPVAEQEAIAEALGDADALVESLERLLTKKRNLKKAAMQQLLTGKKRLPGFETPWVEKSLHELLTTYRLGGNYPNRDIPSQYPLMKMGNLDRGQFNTNKVEYIPSYRKPEPADLLRNGDVLFNTRNTLDLVGKVAVWRDELPIAYFNSNLLRLEFDTDKIGSQFFMNLVLNSDRAVCQLRELATGTTSVAAIYTRDLLKMLILIPSDCSEHVAIVEILEDMEAEIAAIEAKINKARQIKAGMMQELLTGKTRLV